MSEKATTTTATLNMVTFTRSRKAQCIFILSIFFRRSLLFFLCVVFFALFNFFPFAISVAGYVYVCSCRVRSFIFIYSLFFFIWKKRKKQYLFSFETKPSSIDAKCHPAPKFFHILRAKKNPRIFTFIHSIDKTYKKIFSCNENEII